ncbi:MAG TPA: hypothetical protein VHP57_01990 [Acidimicrobiia bacterium]|nr:hypothetical protein [Acidimicrobiia bacterium]
MVIVNNLYEPPDWVIAPPPLPPKSGGALGVCRLGSFDVLFEALFEVSFDPTPGSVAPLSLGTMPVPPAE